MTIIVAIERRWLSRQEALDRLLQMVRFLYTADSYHGILPHFLNGETGRTIPFTRKDDGGDLVETAFLLAGLCAPVSTSIATMRGSELRAASMRSGVKPNGTGTRGGRPTAVLALEPEQRLERQSRNPRLERVPDHVCPGRLSPHHAIDDEVYHRGWAQAAPSSMAGISTGSCRSARISEARCSLLS